MNDTLEREIRKALNLPNQRAFWKPRSYHYVHSSLLLAAPLSHMNTIHTLISTLIFTLILSPSTPTSSKCLLYFLIFRLVNAV
jgi:hypothetical protein